MTLPSRKERRSQEGKLFQGFQQKSLLVWKEDESIKVTSTFNFQYGAHSIARFSVLH